MTARAYLRRLVRRLAPALRNARGATAVEYGIFIALIAAVIVVLVSEIGLKVKAAFETIKGQL